MINTAARVNWVWMIHLVSQVLLAEKRSSHVWAEFGITLSVRLFNAQRAHHGGGPGCATNPQLSNIDKYKWYTTHHLFVHSMISSWNEAANWNLDAFFPTRWSRFQTEVMVGSIRSHTLKLNYTEGRCVPSSVFLHRGVDGRLHLPRWQILTSARSVDTVQNKYSGHISWS